MTTKTRPSTRFAERQPPPTKRARAREHPPIAEAPEWAWPLAPEWDAAALALYPEEHAAAGRFWAWLTDTYASTRTRMWTGYRYLEGLTSKDDEAEALYRSLGTWLHWLEAAWWLLTVWYAEDHRCRWLHLPLPGAHDGDGNPLRVVREYRGLSGEVLLEDALRLWRDWAILHHHLPDVGEAPTPPPAPASESGSSAAPRPVARPAGVVTRGGQREDADLWTRPDHEALSRLPATPHQLRLLVTHGVADDGDGAWPPIRARAYELLEQAIARKRRQPGDGGSER